MTVIIEIVFIVIFSILIRLLFGVSGKKNVLDDTFNHLYYINTQKGHKYFNFNFEGSILPTKFGYPRFQHWLISRFNENSWLFVGQTLNIVYEILYILAIYGLSYFFFKEITISPKESTLISYPAWVALLFSTSPILFPYSSARLTGIGSSRSLGNLLMLGLFLTWMQFQLYEHYYFLVLSFFFVCAIILCSLFAIQVMCFSFFFLSLIYLDIKPFLFIVTSVSLAYLLPIGCKYVLKHKLNHQKWYFRSQRKVSGVGNRNDMKEFILMPIYLFRHTKLFFHRFFTQFTFIIAIYSIPGLILYFYYFNNFYHFESLGYINNIFLTSLFTFSLISFKSLSFLGEAERYFEYSISFFCLLIVYLSLTGIINEQLLFLLLAIQVVIILITFLYKNNNLLAHNSFTKEQKNDDLDDILKFLKNKKEINILTIPIKHSRFLSYKTFNNQSIKYYQRFMDSKDGFRSFSDETKEKSIELPITNLSIFRDKYNIEYILFLKTFDQFSEEMVVEYDLKKSQIVFENNLYRIYKF